MIRQRMLGIALLLMTTVALAGPPSPAVSVVGTTSTHPCPSATPCLETGSQAPTTRIGSDIEPGLRVSIRSKGISSINLTAIERNLGPRHPSILTPQVANGRSITFKLRAGTSHSARVAQSRQVEQVFPSNLEHVMTVNLALIPPPQPGTHIVVLITTGKAGRQVLTSRLTLRVTFPRPGSSAGRAIPRPTGN